jgi:tripartite ATP-independent transporter DctM subunit
MVGFGVLVLFCVLLALRVPISMAMLISSAVILIALADVPLLVIPQYLVHGLSSFEILAVPFFILAAELMNSGGMTQRIFKFGQAAVGWMPGGLAQVNIVGSVIFAGISGTAVADAAGLGRVEIRAMTNAGYDKGFASAVTIASCLIGPLIPPSVIAIIYAIVAEVSVGKMLLAGVGPGLLLAAVLMVFCYFIAKSGRYACPIVPFPSRAEFVRALWEGLPALLAPIFIIALIIGGWLTATEAGVFATFYSLAVSLLIYRELTVRKAVKALVRALLSSGMVMLMIAVASLMSWIVTREQVGLKAAVWFSQLASEQWVQLLWINVFLLIVGTVLEGVPALLVLVPVLLPIALQIGIDPIHFGLILIFNLLIATVSPPMGVVLFVVANYTGLTVGQIVRACLPFFIPLIGTLLIITYIPQVTLWLPNLLIK